ncbi:peroxiredoxin [Natronomonas salina]|uniref:peroxiredoxin n=1 Tax=Natronomonas salina TaxID=1710540 RepID=UPI0015B76C24|nr:peroxiredoxin [Natronomonas salina]QLD89744.1 peroxiredoxin [Natronomonas salina]
MALEAGDPAPDVQAANQHGETVSPEFAEPTVVYFYPRDGTPGCTLEAREFEADIESFRQTGVAVYGVSTDDVDSHREFADEEGLSFDLLADPDGDVAEAFGLEVQDDFVDRITFVLAGGEVQAVVDADTMQPEGHAADVLAAVESLD